MRTCGLYYVAARTAFITNRMLYVIAFWFPFPFRSDKQMSQQWIENWNRENTVRPSPLLIEYIKFLFSYPLLNCQFIGRRLTGKEPVRSEMKYSQERNWNSFTEKWKSLVRIDLITLNGSLRKDNESVTNILPKLSKGSLSPLWTVVHFHAEDEKKCWFYRVHLDDNGRTE